MTSAPRYRMRVTRQIPPYTIQKAVRTPIVNPLPAANPKISPPGMSRNMIGQAMTTNSSSSIRVSMVSDAPLPRGMPSRWRKIMLRADPPAVVGVMADVNSHCMVMRNVCRHESLWSVSTRHRHIMPHSRPATKTRAAIVAVFHGMLRS